MPMHRSGEGEGPYYPFSPPQHEANDVQGINYEVVGHATTVDSTGAPGGSTDNGGNGAFFNFDLRPDDGPGEEDYAVAIHAVETYISDLNEIVSGTSVDVWWFDDTWQDPGGWARNVTDERFLTYQEYSVHTGGSNNSPTATTDGNQLKTSFVSLTGMPVINYDGEGTVLWEYTGGDNGEIAFVVWYEYIPISEDHLLRELVGRE